MLNLSISTEKDIPKKAELEALLKIEQLPAMPHSALIVLQLDNNLEKVNINDLVRPIEADPGLTTQVLKFLNSAYFGIQNSVSNIKQGIALAGIRIVKNFVLWKAVFSLIPKTDNSIFDVKQLWQDSLRRALFARMIVSRLRGDVEVTFVGALLQDMAIPVLLKKKPNQYTTLIHTLGKNPDKRLSELEQEELGWTHAEAAEIMCRSWKIPQNLASLIANHTKFEPYMEEPAKNPEQLAVSLSALLPSVVNLKWGEQEKLKHAMDVLFPMSPTMLNDVFVQVDKEFELYAVVLQIPKPKVALVDMIS
ncbi:MAG: HDOD domain-containing protein [Planctomycetaceae bacterium]|nr:HDOD domain-containing protein [Planctomycetaceae bacterium]